MIEVLSSSALATVQDPGRTGSLRWGVGTSGAMDKLALAAGNLMLGNDADAAAIEVPVFPFKLRFGEDCAFALTGADCAARLDAQPLMPWWAHQARAGQVLTLGLPQGGAQRGSRAMVCLAGGVDVPVVLGSRSTQLRGAFGGHEGRALRRGDVLRAAGAGRACATGFGLVPPALTLPLQVDGVPAVRVLPAAEYQGFEEASRAAFWAGEWKITAQSDRYGYRLAGEALRPLAAMEMRSHGIVPGVIQVPHSGQPIIQMRDAQPSGGYPKFGTVIEADLWRLGQAPIGSRIRFVETSWDEAVAALDEVQAWLDKVGRLVELHRSAPRKN
ncbi:biotin-dependent carboxyltransferase family protein [Variovorax sp. J22G21]|uniref:5-oxoprolinase subunit C family protein n=1 Tax=Variovorax fucosicus TaxID=3053517 RepID=UPI002576417E|nr:MULTISPECIES: biotin-dependent carboxyltransferase family protein [unclassified Variovorax]MDM0039860.1 biotin-dependent carboxyltransferase family protein [Variovorax sp. J22R193]MDM0064591.1 biotin-dependent carboxyltransferase family protein [Variovorax sp. J22G21]